MTKIKQQLIQALENKDFSDLDFIFSAEVLDNALTILRELLDEEKFKFEKLLEIEKQNIVFDTFQEKSNLSYFWSLLNHLQSVDANEKIESIIEEFEPEYIAFWNELVYSKPYFEMLEYCLANCELDSEQKRIIEEDIKSFVLRWINLSEQKQVELKDISISIAKLSQDFTNNIVKDKAKWNYVIYEEDIILQLPEESKKKALENAKEKWLNWYLFTADPNLMSDIMDYCSDSSVRKDFYDASISFASYWEFDNREIVLEILKLKEKKAKILWYNNFAELSLIQKMAESPNQVKELIEGISEKAKRKANLELETLKTYFSLEIINPWDLAYYSNKYKKAEYNIDDKILKTYFEFDNVLAYLFSLVEKLYWLKLKKIKSDKKNKIYEVYRDGKLISYYFLDAFYRPEKRPWAWADNIRSKDYLDETLPIIVNVCNFQYIWKAKNLLSLRDVETLFHEFGHAIHEMLSESKYSDLSGFWVEWDFVELPSQIHENWVKERESMKLLSKHFETGESLSDEILDKLDLLETFNSGLFVVRQNEFALLDMYLYSEETPKTVEELDKKTLELSNRFGIFIRQENYKSYASFNHIFGWWYAAGYYSYMWAEILEAQVFEKIKLDGMFERSTWKAFCDTILAQGYKKDAKDLFFDYIWEEVKNDAFMKRKWLF